MKIQATNDNIWITRLESISEQGGILIPDSAKKKMHKGLIITTGKLVSDPLIKDGSIAIFNKSAGFSIEEEGIGYTILTQVDIIGVTK